MQGRTANLRQNRKNQRLDLQGFARFCPAFTDRTPTKPARSQAIRVHYSLGDAFREQIEWRCDLGSIFNDGPPANSPDYRMDGKTFPKTTLVAGGFKLDRVLMEPFHSFHPALARHVYEADAILIGRYGFADEHVNRALRNRLLGTTNNHRPPVMVLDYTPNQKEPPEFRSDPWNHRLCRSLNIFRVPASFPPRSPSEHVAAREFETLKPRIAIWYGGFIQAEERVDSVTDWLSGTEELS
jgi:hypothetical protein